MLLFLLYVADMHVFMVCAAAGCVMCFVYYALPACFAPQGGVPSSVSEWGDGSLACVAEAQSSQRRRKCLQERESRRWVIPVPP